MAVFLQHAADGAAARPDPDPGRAQQAFAAADAGAGEDGKTFMYRLAQAELGIDKWGRPVTSCTVEPLGKEESEERKKRSKVRKLSPRQRDGLESLRDAAERYGYRITGSEDYPPNRKVVPEDTWRDEFYRRVFSSEDSPATKRQAFHRVRLDLVGAGHVAGYDGKFWSTAPSEATGGQTCWA